MRADLMREGCNCSRKKMQALLLLGRIFKIKNRSNMSSNAVMEQIRKQHKRRPITM
jgi:predicted transcriptional regulator